MSQLDASSSLPARSLYLPLALAISNLKHQAEKLHWYNLVKGGRADLSECAHWVDVGLSPILASLKCQNAVSKP